MIGRALTGYDRGNVVAQIDGQSEYTIVRQLWNTTTDVLNYWWLSENYILAQTKHEFIIYKKQDEVDPWNGDKWKADSRIDVDYILTNASCEFYVSSAYKATPFIYLFETIDADTIHLIKWNIYPDVDSNDINDVFVKQQELTIDIKKKELGEKLGEQSTILPFNLCTYSDFSADTLLGSAHISATRVKTGTAEIDLIGLVLNKNLDQWVLYFNNTTNEARVIQGYGYVGLKGELTGGQIPTIYFNIDYGFSGTVQPIKNLGNSYTSASVDDYNISNISELSIFNGGIFGTATKQYYVMQSMSSFVSHVLLDIGTGRFIPEEVSIMNNYELVYKSPSRQLCRLDGLYGREISIFDLWPDTGYLSDTIKSLVRMASLGYVRVVYQNFLFTNLLYLNQTLGQYAYVWYTDNYEPSKADVDAFVTKEGTDLNFKEIKDGDTKNDVTLMMQDDFLFDIKRVKQKFIQSEDSFDSIWLRTFFVIAQAMFSATGVSAPNAVQSIMNTGNVAKAFSAGFLTSLAGQVPDAISNEASALWLNGTSYVTATKRLDMFYATSDRSKFFAGRGFVNHNLVSQCIAQSSTSTHIQGYVMSSAVINAEKYKLQMKIQIATQRILLEAFEGQAKTYAGSGGLMFFGVANGGNTIGAILAIVFWGLAQALKFFIYFAELGLQSVDTMLQTTGIYPNNKISVTKQVSKHNFDIEGTHRYGSKSLSLFWPAYGVYGRVQYTDEYVEARSENIPFSLDFQNTGVGSLVFSDKAVDFSTVEANNYSFWNDKENIPYYQAMMRGTKVTRNAPANMAVIEGSTGFLPTDDYKNENISVSRPVFPSVLTHDYEIDREWNIGVCASNGGVVWTFCKDTKIIDGDYSNIVDTGSFCGIACPYTAIEIKPRILQRYVRPYAVTPQALQFNITGLNVVYDHKMYHAFDGMSYRYVEWHGDSGLNKEYLWRHYMFQRNDRFKRSNILPPNQFLGNFTSRPVISYSAFDEMENVITSYSQNAGLANDIPGENKDLQRYAIPVHTEQISTLPAMIKTLGSYPLSVIDGNTCLVTDLRNTQGEYKSPKSHDFNIGDTLYRVTDEYICRVSSDSGVTLIEKLMPILGLTYLGSTLQQAFFYSQATRCYYSYTGGTTLSKVAMVERFRNMLSGKWDFVNQQLVIDCLITMDRLDSNVHDDEDEVDNMIVPVLDNNGFAGELTPPNYNIMDSNSLCRLVALPSGLCYQGPNRVQINRYIFNAYMLDDVLNNKGKWKKVPREIYHPFREYYFKFHGMDEYPDIVDTDGNYLKLADRIRGWTHNPFLLVTSPLGMDRSTDCIFEWEVIFAWTKEMDDLYAENEYVCVNVMSETFAPGGKVFNRVDHIFLYKKLFICSNNVGYYSARYQGNNGGGNRERLHIWCDGIIAISQIKLYYKPLTEQRTSQLIIQEDIKDKFEM